MTAIPCPFEITVPEQCRRSVQEWRDGGKLKGHIVIVENGGPNIIVQCSDDKDADNLLAAAYLGLLP